MPTIEIFSIAGAETKTVDYDVLVNLDDHISVDIFIDDPSNQWFGPLEFDVDCPKKDRHFSLDHPFALTAPGGDFLKDMWKKTNHPSKIMLK